MTTVAVGTRSGGGWRREYQAKNLVSGRPVAEAGAGRTRSANLHRHSRGVRAAVPVGGDVGEDDRAAEVREWGAGLRPGPEAERDPGQNPWVMGGAPVEIIRTVTGDIAPATAGVTLVHEHVIVDTSDALGDPDLRVNDPAVAARELDIPGPIGIDSIVNASPSDMGSQPELVVETASLSRKNIIQGAGLFRDATYPRSVQDTSVDELADRFSTEVRSGISGTKVKAGVFGEIGFSPEGISPRERKVALAVAMAHLACGAPILTHTFEGQFAIEHTDIFLKGGVDPMRIAVGHLDCNNDLGVHVELASRGCFLAYDRIGILRTQSDEKRVEIVLKMLDRGYLGQLMLSSDTAKRSRLRANGGRGYSVVLEDFVGLLTAAGVSMNEVNTILIDNPRRFLAFAPK